MSSLGACGSHVRLEHGKGKEAALYGRDSGEPLPFAVITASLPRFLMRWRLFAL